MAKLPADLSKLTEEQRLELEEKLKKMPPEELKQLQEQQCIFCQIISGKVPSKQIYEDKSCLVILDINPAAKGHLLLLPKPHYAIMPQIPEKEIKHLFLVSKALSQVLLKSLNVDGTTIFAANGLAAGQRAQHFILHLIPRKSGDGVLDLPERIIPQDIIEKVKGAVESKLNELLGVRNENMAVAVQEEPLPKPKEEKFTTSSAAKRYHKEKCAFAQNIPEDKKVILTKEEVMASGKEPCTCVTGKRIPLKNKSKAKLNTTEEPAKKIELKKPIETKSKIKKEAGASLDDIAGLFK
ncbi:MAG: HIT domain-containing protein [Nanoarchaeota archaeon]